MTAAALLAQIHAQPDDNGPRLAYADLLHQQGDPRGELIALQLLARDPERQRALLAAHGAAWLGPLAQVVTLGETSETRFERGFLAVAELVDGANKHLKKVADAVEWATVEELRGDGIDVALEVLPLPALCRFHGRVPPESLAAIGRRTTPLLRVSRIELASYLPWTAAERAAIAACAQLPNLEELALAPVWTPGVDDVSWLATTPVAARLAWLEIKRPLRPRTYDDEECDAIEALARALVGRDSAVRVALVMPDEDDEAIELVPGPGGKLMRGA
jgi:uncharacterized protein (TIGR02996 family)